MGYEDSGSEAGMTEKNSTVTKKLSANKRQNNLYVMQFYCVLLMKQRKTPTSLP